ncbi:MAG: hypothetical protein ACI4NG_06170 [Candidatus Gallimonas sp.]
MSVLPYLNAFRLYKADVLLLAFAVTFVTSLLKKTAMKNCPKKTYLFLPFGVGLLLYAAYAVLVTRSFLPLTQDALSTVESGFACGCAATLYYLAYEQFFRAKKAQSPLLPLLEGFVDEEKREEAANRLSEESKSVPDEELLRFVSDTLAEYAAENASEAELSAAAQTIAELLRQLRDTN